MLVEILLILATLSLLYTIFKKPSDYPPGPWRIPFIGFIPWYKSFEELVLDLRKKYGNIVSLQVGSKTAIFLYDFKMIKEGYSGFNMADRPKFKLMSLLNYEKKLGVISTNGEHWQSIRRFSLRHLRDLGMGKSKLVSAVQTEAMTLVDHFKSRGGKPGPISTSIAVPFLNVIWQMVASKRYSMDDRKILEFDELITTIQTNFTAIMLTDFFTWMNYIPKSILKRLTKEKLYDILTEKMTNFLKETIEEHIATLNEDDPRDFIDAYLIEMKNQENDPDSSMSVKDLTCSIADFFGAGTETTKTTIEWCIFYLAKHPDIQLKLQREIDSVLPQGTQATLEDKSRLPYTDAFIHEILRHTSLATVGFFHTAPVDTMLNGYRIPKDAIIMGVQYWCHYNPENFEHPEEFRPERFLNLDGKFVTPKDGFLPFSIGKRQCLGEALARMELFIFLTTLVQNCHFAEAPGKAIDLVPRKVPFVHFPKMDQDLLITMRGESRFPL